MAKAKPAKAAAKKAEKPNLFARAKGKEKAAPKKAVKGTVLELPKSLDNEGHLDAECQVLHDAISGVISADADKKAAEGRCNLHKGEVNGWANSAYPAQWAKLGVMPPQPITIVNHKGQSVTYVVQNRLRGKELPQEQIDLLASVIGEGNVDSLMEDVSTYSFNSKVMSREVNGRTVEEIVAEKVSEVLADDPEIAEALGEDEELIEFSTKRLFKVGTLERLAEFTGSDAKKIAACLAALEGGVVRYTKA